MMSVPVTQLALGVRKEGALVHFAFGGPEWRLFRGAMGLTGLLMLLLLTMGLAAAVLGSLGGGAAVEARGAILMAVGFFALFVFFGLRFGLVMPAVAASESEPLLPRAWKLTAGNSGRLFLVAAATLGPVWIASSAAQAVLEGPQSLTPNLQSSTAELAVQIHLMALQMPAIWGIKFLIAPLLLGLALGAGASAYRALAGENIA
jgi:hypothetical protein